MTKKNALITFLALLLVAALYCYEYRDLFRHPVIQISHTIRARPAFRWGALTVPAPDTVIFSLRNPYKLISIKVIPVSDLETNKYPHPVWELVSRSNSVPTRAFFYGERIRGLHPAVAGAQPDDLVPDVTYRLFVEAVHSVHGQHDFKISPEDQPAPSQQ